MSLWKPKSKMIQYAELKESQSILNEPTFGIHKENVTVAIFMLCWTFDTCIKVFKSMIHVKVDVKGKITTEKDWKRLKIIFQYPWERKRAERALRGHEKEREKAPFSVVSR